MIPAVAQTLAEILAGGTSAISMEQIDFNSPNPELNNQAPRLNLYCYDVRENPQMQTSHRQTDPSTLWFDVSFLLTAWDVTALGEQHILSEALTVLIQHPCLPSERLAPALRGKGTLPMRISADGLSEIAAIWTALGVPLRPGLYLTVTIPFTSQTEPAMKEIAFTSSQ
ncbi:DUF4255 domain-containing protein [Laspinema olomoucense]|uniref:DUF4255 domain-containing protein n=1 Tax=Laspinema olomoucense D3b TaxID=2953688 RepID=A0ABT2N4Y6_9CYAN|nr:MULTISPECIES: DUF4255 domain-containing protein [unclassified Laspinema]MCT7973049.1 DUF4255 domain-containing protein [Laspinema sp. D3d]MCT7977752.1 DUF4255 domain-containing protein [Laspinema sp. D3b]MCT7989838.1 DUF4255 domain-containing protein [Laspinema sp. D3a]MCT7996998.1 DUF4255 domain-containing protein [Laspinema sp. D3c]